MIRDEFLKKQKETNLSAKELDKIRQFGERSYYTTRISKLSNTKKSLDFSAIMIGVFVLLITISMVVIVILAGGFLDSLVTISIVLGVFWLMELSWFVIFRPITSKKLKKYKAELERIRKEDVEKQKRIYAKINK